MINAFSSKPALSSKPVVTRFAPSPTGRLHLGHLYAAKFARQFADDHGGEMRLRIEDIDHTRCRAEYHTGILEDLDFMKIAHDGDVMVQSDRMAIYHDHLERLKAKGWIYPCHLTRRELDGLLSAPHQSPSKTNATVSNTDLLISSDDRSERESKGDAPAWRLRMEAIRPMLKNLDYHDHGHPPQRINLDAIGDEVIARKDIGTSYHLSVVIDDGDSGITHATRGADLKDQTPLHRIIQTLLDLPETIWVHHPLIADDHGARLAKRADSLSIKTLRDTGYNISQITAVLDAMPKIHHAQDSNVTATVKLR